MKDIWIKGVRLGQEIENPRESKVQDGSRGNSIGMFAVQRSCRMLRIGSIYIRRTPHPVIVV